MSTTVSASSTTTASPSSSDKPEDGHALRWLAGAMMVAALGASASPELASRGIDGESTGATLLAVTSAWYVVQLRAVWLEALLATTVFGVFFWATASTAAVRPLLWLVGAMVAALAGTLVRRRLLPAESVRELEQALLRFLLLGSVILHLWPGVNVPPIAFHFVVLAAFLLPIGCAIMSWWQHPSNRRNLWTTPA